MTTRCSSAASTASRNSCRSSRARVALADPRVAGQHVVAVGAGAAAGRRRRPGRAGRPPGAAPSASAPSCTRSACRCGSSPGSAGRRSRPPSSARTSASAERRPCRPVAGRGQHVGELAARPAAAARRPRAPRRSGVDAAGRARRPTRRSGCAPVQRARRPRRAGRPARRAGRPGRRRCCRRRRAAAPARRCRRSSSSIATPSSSRSRPARQVFCATPPSRYGARRGGVEPPAHPGAAHPVARAARARRRRSRTGARTGGVAGQVEHLGRGDPRVGEVEQPATDGEHRVGLPQGAVGEPDPQPVAGVRGRRLLGRRAEPERGGDQRRERLDVGAHHHDVARLQGRVVGEQPEQHLAQHLDLPRAGRGRRAPAR